MKNKQIHFCSFTKVVRDQISRLTGTKQLYLSSLIKNVVSFEVATKSWF